MPTEHTLTRNCVYILKTGKNLFKIGKTRDLHKRLSAYHTHLPVLFRVIRQYPANNMTALEESLHIVFQHKRLKGEWFELNSQDLIICDNIARHFASLAEHDDSPGAPNSRRPQPLFPQTPSRHTEVDAAEAAATTNSDPLMQVTAANEKYLRDYSRVADDIRLGLTTDEIVELNEGAVNKTIIATVRRLLQYQTPNSQFLSEWSHIVGELQTGASENEIIKKYNGLVSRTTIRTVRRILRNQLY